MASATSMRLRPAALGGTAATVFGRVHCRWQWLRATRGGQPSTIRTCGTRTTGNIMLLATTRASQSREGAMTTQRRDLDKKKQSDKLPFYHEAVGLVTTSWSLYEQEVDFALLYVSGIEDFALGIALTSQIPSIRNKLLALEAMFSIKGASKAGIRTIRKFMNEIEETTRLRNRMTHDALVLDQDFGPSWMRSRLDRHTVNFTDPAVHRDLINLGRKIVEHHKRFRVIWTELYDGPPLPFLDSTQ